MQVNTIRDLLISELCEACNAEDQLAEKLTQMEAMASNPEIKQILRDSASQAADHMNRLLDLCDDLGIEGVDRQVNKSIRGLLQQGDDLMKSSSPGVRDGAIVVVLQRIKQYEAAAYNSLRTLAESLGEDEAADIFQSTLFEEKESSGKLLRLIEQHLYESYQEERRVA